MLTGSEFQAAGPATASELPAHRTRKLPRADDRGVYRSDPMSHLTLTLA